MCLHYLYANPSLKSKVQEDLYAELHTKAFWLTKALRVQGGIEEG
jgi:hypothetical protein